MHIKAGKIASPEDLINVDEIVKAFWNYSPSITQAEERVSFGTSGHRGTSTNKSFNAAHIAAITHAIIDYREENNTNGPIFIGADTHLLSEPAMKIVKAVMLIRNVDARVSLNSIPTPTPVISRAIITYNRKNSTKVSDGIVISPSHNPPQDGGIKYNQSHGGPSDTICSDSIAEKANYYLQKYAEIWTLSRKYAHRDNLQVDDLDYLLKQEHRLVQVDYVSGYIDDLAKVIDLELIANANLKIAVNALGGAAWYYWPKIAEKWGLDITQIGAKPNAQFAGNSIDWDGEIRMDPSSEYVMQGVLSYIDDYDLVLGNDADADRHGIVTKKGLMKPNHYLAVATDYLLKHREKWHKNAYIGKTAVSSLMIDRVAKANQARIYETPVGFKWFVNKLDDCSILFACEESAGASLLELEGNTWTTDKDGIVLALLAAEIMASSKIDLADYYNNLTGVHGEMWYSRSDAKAESWQKKILKSLKFDDITLDNIAGEKIITAFNETESNGESLGGIKVITENSWFAARPSGTENVYKIYAESAISADHLKQLVESASELIDTIFDSKNKNI